MVLREEWLDGEVFKWDRSVIAPAGGSPRIGNDAQALRYIRTKNYVYIQNLSGGTAKNLVTRVSHLDGSLRMFSYAAFLTSLGTNGDTLIGGPRIVADGDELIFTGIYVNNASQPYSFTGYTIRFGLDNIMYTHKYAINDLGYSTWNFDTFVEPYLDKVTKNVVWLFTRMSASGYDDVTKTVTTNFVKRRLIFDRNTDTYQNVILDQGPKITDFPDYADGISGSMYHQLGMCNYEVDFHYTHSAFVVTAGPVLDYTTQEVYFPGFIRVIEPGTGAILAELTHTDTSAPRTIQAPSWLPPWDMDDQLRRGKSFISLERNRVTMPAEETVPSYLTAEHDYAVMDCFNNAVILTAHIPYNSRDDTGYHIPKLMAVDNANNLYVYVTKKLWSSGFWSTYTTLSKYNSLGVFMWNVEFPGYTFDMLKIQPVFYENQTKISIGKDYIFVIDTETGALVFDGGNINVALDTPNWTSDGRVVFMDVFNTTAQSWEPRMLVERAGTNQTMPMEWSKLVLAENVGTILLAYTDKLGNPKSSNANVRTYIDNVDTFIPVSLGYRYIAPFELRAITASLGYLVENENHSISIVEDRTITIVIDKIDFSVRNTYYLSTPQDLLDMRTRNDITGIYIMTNDIDMAGVPYTAAFGSEFEPFMGDFDGGGFTISNLVISQDPAWAWLSIGFLSYCKNAIVGNIKFLGCSLDGTAANGTLGILAGRFENGSFTGDTTMRPNKLYDCLLEDCTITVGTSNGTGVAVGRYNTYGQFSPDPLDGIIVKSSVINVPVAKNNIGGAFGLVYTNTQQSINLLTVLKNIYAEVAINLTAGLVYKNIGGAMASGSYNSDVIIEAVACKMTVSSGTYSQIGLMGEQYCYGNSSVFNNLGADIVLASTPTLRSGGLMGILTLGYSGDPGIFTIEKAYVAMSSPGVPAGTSDILIGEIYRYDTETAIVTDTYYDSDINDFGNLYGSSSRNTAAMKTMANYEGWDFTNVWDIKEGLEYPTLLFAGDPPVSIDFEFFEDEGLGLTDLEIRLSSFKRMKAIATYADMSTKDISTSIAIAADPANLTAITGNKIKAIGVGFAQLSVSYNRYTEYGFAELYGPDDIVVTSPNGIVLSAGKKLRLKSKANYRDGYIQDTSLLSEWVSDSPEIVSITPDGVVQGISGGSAGISNTYFGVTGYLALTVSSLGPPTITRIDSESATAYVYFTLLDPVADITYFKATAYLEEAKTTILDSVDVATKPENFRVSRNKGVSWSQVPAEGTVPSANGEDIYCVKLFIGPRPTAWVEVGAALIEGAGGGTGPSDDDVTAPIITVLPATGLFSTDQTITITTDEPADVYYTLDETTPTVNSTKYTVPITITDDTILTYFAVDPLDNPTYVLTETYAFNRVLPVVSSKLPSGSYTGPQSALLETTKGNIYYTVDGTEPSASSTLYTSAVTIPEGVTTVLKFLAIDAYGNISATLTMTYTVATAPEGTSFGKPVLMTVPSVSGSHTANAAMRNVYFLISGLTVGASYVLETINPVPANYVDCQLYTYNMAQAQIGYDDDGADTQGLSKLTFTATETSIYAKVNDYGNNNDIVFQLSIVAV